MTRMSFLCCREKRLERGSKELVWMNEAASPSGRRRASWHAGGHVKNHKPTASQPPINGAARSSFSLPSSHLNEVAVEEETTDPCFSAAWPPSASSLQRPKIAPAPCRVSQS